MLSDVLFGFRVPEPLTKKIIFQTLHAVHFCHQHNVRLIAYFNSVLVWLGLGLAYLRDYVTIMHTSTKRIILVIN